MTEKRSERLKSDYLDMLKIQARPYLSWIPTKGEPPYAEEYLLTAKLRTYVLSAESGMYKVGVVNSCVIRVTLWDSYPYVAPSIKMLSIPPIFHPDWYSKGTYCSSEPWRPDIPLKDWVMRMLKTVAYDPSVIVGGAPANYKALDWYIRRRDDAALFPSDATVLSENSPEELAAAEASMTVSDEIIDSWRV